MASDYPVVFECSMCGVEAHERFESDGDVCTACLRLWYPERGMPR